METLQLERAERLKRALATSMIVGWRLLWLTYAARQHPEQSIAGIFSAEEWQSLYCTIHLTTVLPEQPPTLGKCIDWIGQLGGYVDQSCDRDPGVKVLWRGLQRLHDIAATWRLLRSGKAEK